MKVFETDLCRFSQCVLPLGIQGENLARSVVIKVGEYDGDYWALNVQNPNGVVYPAAVREENGCVVWAITNGDTAAFGSGKAELTLYGKDGEIIKSAIAKTFVHASLPAPTEKMPDPVQTWIDAAYKVLDELKQAGAGNVGAVRYDQPQNLTDEQKAQARENIGAGTGNGSGGVDFETDKTLSLKNGILSVNTAKKMEKDNTLPITSAAVYVEVGNINALLETI